MSASPQVRLLPLLVIEDEPAVLAFLRAALERAGYQLMHAKSAAEGLELLQEGEFFGVISDMRTPGPVNGFDVHTWLNANRPELARKLIFITGDIVNENTRAILDNTGTPCVEKPFRVAELIAAVEKTIGPAIRPEKQ
jgi:DNA-binding response OmpR family regulator